MILPQQPGFIKQTGLLMSLCIRHKPTLFMHRVGATGIMEIDHMKPLFNMSKFRQWLKFVVIAAIIITAGICIGEKRLHPGLITMMLALVLLIHADRENRNKAH